MKISLSNNHFSTQNHFKNPHHCGNSKENNCLENIYIAPDSFERCHNGIDQKNYIRHCKKPPAKKLKRGQILGKNNKIFCNNTTDMFRDDIDWKQFGNFLYKQFKDCKKVNTYNYAASTGEEPYSLSILLQTRFKEDAKKFFPIYAKDLDTKLIIQDTIAQKTRRIYIPQTFSRAQRALGVEDSELKGLLIPDNHSYGATLRQNVISPIKFSCANILDDIKNIDNKNPSLVMCRNMWPYINSSEYDGYAEALYEKLAPGSVVVIGFFDYTADYSDKIFPDSLKKAGFKEAKADINSQFKLVFEKN